MPNLQSRAFLDLGPWALHVRGFQFWFGLVLSTLPVAASLESAGPVLFLDFEENAQIHLQYGATQTKGPFGTALEFTSAAQFAHLDFSEQLHGLQSMTVGGWFFPYRKGEGVFFSRGLPEIGPRGNRFFRPGEDWVNFVLGSDQRGFFMGTINGNGHMPLVHVTVTEVPFDAWNQLVVVKTANGFQKFYLNGRLVHTDEHAVSAGKIHPFHDQGPGEPIRLAMPQGGMIGEAWIFPRELSAQEIKSDFEEKRDKYRPAHPVEIVPLREMNQHPMAGLWNKKVTAENWPGTRKELTEGALKVLGPFPEEKIPLELKIVSEEDCGNYLRRKISIQVQPGDRMPAYLLIPKKRKGRVPAVICFYGTSSGAGKDTTVGISGRAPGSLPHPNYSFAIDLVEAGFVAFAPDYLRDGERIKPGRRPYDTTDFYEKFPEWSIHGKDSWDTSRAIDYLQTLDFVDPEKIGMTGHSYGGHSTIFTAALEPRIKAVVANGPVSDFLHHGMHWGVPKGGGNSQSMPALRPYVLDHTLPLPITFYQFTALIAPRPLLVGQAAGERRPMEEENYAAVKEVYDALGFPNRVRYHWYAGDHDFPPEARRAMVDWFRQWFGGVDQQPLEKELSERVFLPN